MFDYFLYCRKSTDTEDMQVLSIAAQLSELRSFAKREGLNIKETFIEKQSAKVPGRPIFTAMLSRIEKGEAQGIICWKLDRLARNPIDGGQISWMLQRGIIQHIQTHDRGYFPTDNVLMMSVEFGMANQYILDLSQNTSRGLREKARQGIYPGQAPLGYMNDKRTKTIALDRKQARVIKQAFELYAQNESRLEDISLFLAKNGIKTEPTRRWKSEGGNPLKKDQISRLLCNPFYYGYFYYSGELHEGKHQPIITKKLFDRVQAVLEERSKPQRAKIEPKALCGLFQCGECGMMVTCEYQKGHTYYRCSKKSKTVKCRQPYIREEELNRQLSEEMQKFSLPEDWAKELNQMADNDKLNLAQSSAGLIQEAREELAEVNIKLKRVIDTYIDQDIERAEYLERRAELMSRKKTLEEKINDLELCQNNWLEPMREWLKDAQNVGKISLNEDLIAKKSFAKKIFGSNLYLSAKKISGLPKTQWAALAAAAKKRGEIQDCYIVVPEVGVEPTWGFPRSILSAVCMPVPALGPIYFLYFFFFYFSRGE
ncbi:MAG TPA: recombinase family protein [Candidatus Pacearchaeota archaeon]|nr:recombinase family protein [Candidatus Pacearchaeota archaeon]